MADRMSTRIRYDRIRDNGAKSRTINGSLKRKAQASRTVRMKKLINEGTFPYTPAVQSWLSVQLGIPFTQISEDQAKAAAK
ncbi:hypothetical protein [Frigoriglobus tundricola]|uniref:Uncharacterized protein n=1 Tax=Frigoriglobus tundricola TaxID=2774151 RepID=A0A6M5YLC2_9BACT|nr:hypothetical protein [Frigoriglobus tundricola]QJW94096.1 hypothetical protein FTUN_1615 [Frigoriglobus tundricola]